MDNKQWLEAAANDFFDVLVQGGNLQDLSDTAYSYLGNPLMITNERGLIISKARDNKPYHDKLFDEFHEKGYVPREKYPMMSAEIYADQMKNGKVVIFEKAYISHRLMIYQENIDQGFILRCLMLESKRPFTVIDEQIFEMFSKTVRLCLLNSKIVRSFRSNSVEFFFYETLIGHIDTVNNEREVTEYLGVSPRDRRSLLIVKNVYGSAAPLSLHDTRNWLEKLFDHSVSILDGDYIVLLVSADSKAQLRQNLVKASTFFRQNNLRGCVSRVFDNLRYLPLTYTHLKQALDLGIKLCGDIHLFFYSDLEIFNHLDKLDNEALNANCFLPVLEVLESDRKNGSEYLQALYAYSITFGNCSRAAKLLGIHYNSMKSRLAKAEDIMGCSLNGFLPTIYSTILIILLKELDSATKYILLDQLYREQLENREVIDHE